MIRGLARLNRLLVKVETALAGGLIVTVAVVVFLQVAMRYLFAYPNPWSEEFSRFCFIWVSMLGASLAVERRAHFGFDQVTRGLTPRVKSVVAAVAGGVVLAFSGVLIWTGVALMALTAAERSSALNLPISGVYAAVPVSGGLMVVHLLAALGDSAGPAGPGD